jgi:hypothetical protein
MPPIDDFAVDAKLGELPVEGIAGRTGLVAHPRVPAAAELLDQLAHGFGAVGELAEAANPPRPSAMAAVMVSA